MIQLLEIDPVGNTKSVDGRSGKLMGDRIMRYFDHAPKLLPKQMEDNNQPFGITGLNARNHAGNSKNY